MKTFYQKTAVASLLVAVALTAGLYGCANSMPVPGGTESVNETCFSSQEEMEKKLASLVPGTPENDVLSGLCHKKETLQKLDRRELRIALLGGENIPLTGTNADRDTDLIRGLYAYRLNFRNVRRKHGFSSPIRIRTEETGFSYAITLIFQDGRLFEKPIVSGGIVRNSKSGTIFDFVTPGTIIDHTVP